MRGHAPRKRFGQHFLADSAVLAAIVAEIDPRPGESIVEIGPGLGALTDALLPHCRPLTVIELDRDLAARLRRRPELRVIEADVLTIDFTGLATELRETTAGQAAAVKLRVVGNLPYNISSPILFHLLGAAEVVADQHFMLQEEVVDRIAASPGHKDYGRLSVMLQWRYHVEKLLRVPPEAFEPPPRVQSAVLRMIPWPRPAPLQQALLEELVAVAFSQRRKLLRHTLGRWLDQRHSHAAFDLQRRAEEVPVAEYVALTQALEPLDGPSAI